ncbi:hypothetical protein [Paenibacillus ehimensis]|uniref:Uncharacterized protein n=1 Tax=Paenibacillus ehimensis TaxID=79264 RepID=A0ABT8VIK2_9BACL|nr:hypothetical protein [Paenibacillus ehimensis]MDO3680816.1 hypothetical protein [Paenibacillus ehimensis]MEC0213121.1 hypothetical protein [Paenibacillus ehimensis]
MRKSKIFALLLGLFLTVFAVFPFSVSASDVNVAAQPAPPKNSTFAIMDPTPGSVANLRIFASSDASGSSIPSIDGHAWIVLTNYQSSAATFGRLSGIGQYKSVSVGTWGNKSEHTGLWYNLEAKYVSSYNAYPGRVSLSMDLDAGQLATVNSLIINNDAWSTFNNCSDFASKVWNAVSSTKLSNGSFHTPTALRDSIKAQSWYVSASPFSYDYVVYYAQGTGTPVRSIYE